MWMAADQFTTKVYVVQFVTIAVKYQIHFFVLVPFIVVIEAFIFQVIKFSSITFSPFFLLRFLSILLFSIYSPRTAHDDEIPLMLEDQTTTTEAPSPGFIITTTSAPAISTDCYHNGVRFIDGV